MEPFLPHGIGACRYPPKEGGGHFVGEFRYGRPHGRGKLEYVTCVCECMRVCIPESIYHPYLTCKPPSNTSKHLTITINNVPTHHKHPSNTSQTPSITHRYPSGEAYEGEFIDGQFEGRGRLQYAGSTRPNTSTNSTNISTTSTSISLIGGTNKGTIANNANIKVYEGTFLRGKKHGQVSIR